MLAEITRQNTALSTLQDNDPTVTGHPEQAAPNIGAVPPLPQSKYNNRCFENASANEPIFVLRAQDLLAADTVRHWADAAEAAGVNAEKVLEARVIARVMEAWPHRKVPD